jgi:hypothetical protein
MKQGRAEYDLAYGSFLCCGVSSLVISSLEASNLASKLDSGSAGALGFLVMIPLALFLLVAAVVGIVQCVRLWRHWPLIVLGSMSILLAVVVSSDDGSTSRVNAVAIAYGIIVVAICGRWFLVLRRRHSTLTN